MRENDWICAYCESEFYPDPLCHEHAQCAAAEDAKNEPSEESDG